MEIETKCRAEAVNNLLIYSIKGKMEVREKSDTNVKHD